MCLFLIAVNQKKIEDGSIGTLDTTRKKHPLYQHDQEAMALCVLIDIGVENVKAGVTKGSQ